MKVGSRDGPSSVWHGISLPLTRRTGLLLLGGCLICGLCLAHGTLARAAGPMKKPAAETSQGSPVESYAPIGESGYRVPIREFRMKRIIGDERPPAQKPPAEQKPVPIPSEQPPPQRESPVVRETVPRIHWLPFDPERRRASPVLQRPPAPVEQVTPKEDEGPPVRPPIAPEEPLEAVPPKKERLPISAAPPRPGLTTGTRIKETLKGRPLEVQEPADSTGELNGIPLETRKEPLVIPVPPEPEPESLPTPAPLPPPRREHVPAPKPMTVPRTEPIPEPVPAPVPEPETTIHPVPEPEPAPEPMTVPEPGSEPAPQSRPEPAPAPEPEPVREHLPLPAPETKPAPIEPPRLEIGPKPAREPVVRPEPSPEPTQRDVVPLPSIAHEELKPPKEAIPAPEQPRLPTKEELPSPLDEEALQSPEVRSYLREAAPLIEELSLLMTRAPSLTVEDYDPSSGGPTAFPEDMFAKIEHMKRELQILDSKTFAIIPPKKYSGFHSVIRESITQTYQACDTIIEYLREPSERNLSRLQDHLRKARDLIQRTRSGRT